MQGDRLRDQRDLEQNQLSGPLWRNRNFNLLWISQSFSLIGSKVTSIAIPLLVLESFDSARLAGLVVFVALIPAAAIQLHAGVLVERSERRSLMFTLDSARAFAFASLVAAIWLGHLNLYHLVLVLVTDSVVTVLFGLAERSSLPLIVPSAQLSGAFSANEARTRVATLFGPVIAGVLFTVSASIPFVFNAVTSALSAISCAALKGPLRVEQADSPRNFRRDIGEGTRWLREHSFFLWAACVVSATNIIGVGFPLAAIFRLEAMGASPTEIGVVLGALGVGGLIGVAIASRFTPHVRPATVLVSARWVIGVCLLAAALAPSIWLVGASLPLISVAAATSNVALGVARLDAVPATLRARVDSVSSLIGNTPAPVGALLAGFASAQLGPKGGLLTLSFIMLAIALVATSIPGIRRGGPAARSQYTAMKEITNGKVT